MESGLGRTSTFNVHDYSKISGGLSKILIKKNCLFLKKGNKYILHQDIPEGKSGLYAFWWEGDSSGLLNKKYKLKV